MVQPGMEEPNELSGVWICSGNIRTFVTIAVKTGEGEVFENSLPSMLACNNVIDMKGQRIDGSRKVTILAPALCALPDLLDKVPVHERGRSCGFLLRASRALDCMTASRFPTCR